MNWNDLLTLDLYSNIACKWCKKQMIVLEAIIQGVDINNIFLLCSFCSDYDTKEAMEAAKATIIARALDPEHSEEMGYPWI